jgi:hypothetical protein
MTVGFLSLGAITGTSIGDDRFSGFDYPNNAQVVGLLSDGTRTYNAVLQQSALTARQGTLTCTLSTAESMAVGAYFESREIVDFADWDGAVTPVRVLDFTRAIRNADEWACTIVLLESDAPAVSVGPGVGSPIAGLDTTLAADPAIGAVNLRVESVTTVNVGDFVRVGEAGETATEENSEVVRVLVVGTIGAGGTGLDIESDTGGGMVLDRASADEVKTVAGTLLAAPAARGAVNVKVDSVADLSVATVVRIGYLGHYEVRVLTDVGTSGAGGTGLTFAQPLSLDHAPDEWLLVML